MSPERAPKNSWEKTYGYTGNDGKPVDGFFKRKKREIDHYFIADTKHVHHDYRDFFGALGVIEGGGDASIKHKALTAPTMASTRRAKTNSAIWAFGALTGKASM
jgi:hypothetical protein